MRVLAINCGSSTLKFQLVQHDEHEASIKSDKRLAWGAVDRIGGRARVSFHCADGSELEQQTRLPDHESATYRMFRWLRSQRGGIVSGIEAVGHRVVHGGTEFQAPTLIDSQVLQSVEVHSHSAPLHNRPALRAIAAAMEQLGPTIPQVAVFDTAFHSTMPAYATTYALPLELAEKHRIRRFGFHGLAHRYMVERYAEIMGIATGEATIVTLQLGNGCSATAVKNGVSVDTSMGLTPLEGLRVACYYGCLLTRPPDVTGEEHYEYPQNMDRLMGVLGAEPVDWSYKTDCCGGSLQLSSVEIALDLSHKILQNASDVGANIIATACPLCHANLDLRQKQINDEFGSQLDIPIVYFTQLMGIAYGIDAKTLGMHKHLSDAVGLLRSLELLPT